MSAVQIMQVLIYYGSVTFVALFAYRPDIYHRTPTNNW